RRSSDLVVRVPGLFEHVEHVVADAAERAAALAMALEGRDEVELFFLVLERALGGLFLSSLENALFIRHGSSSPADRRYSKAALGGSGESDRCSCPRLRSEAVGARVLAQTQIRRHESIGLVLRPCRPPRLEQRLVTRALGVFAWNLAEQQLARRG